MHADGSITTIGLSAGRVVRPAVAWDPATGVFVAVWATASGIAGARIATDGTRLDGLDVGITSSSRPLSRPAVAASGGQVLVVWQDDGAGAAKGIHGRRFTLVGGWQAQSDSEPIATGPSRRTAPTLIGLSDSRWAIAWAHDGGAATTGADIRGATMRSDGTLEGADYVISANAEWETEPSFQAGPNTGRRVSLVYQKERLDRAIQRVVRRSILY